MNLFYAMRESFDIFQGILEEGEYGMDKHCVLYIVESRVVLKAMLPAMLETRQKNIPVDVFVFDFGAAHPYYGLFEEAAAYLSDLGFNVLRTMPVNNEYDIAYSAYPGCCEELMEKNRIKYNVRFRYNLGAGNVPAASYSQALFNFYDFVICLGAPEAHILSGHAKTVCIGNIKLADYKRTRLLPEGKKTLLYLPTWGADNRVSSVKIDVIKKLVELQSRYRVIAKMHNAMQQFEHQQAYRELFAMLDNVYDTNTPITDLLNEADVVLSDLSGVGYDAVAGDVPLVLFGLGDPVYLGGKLCLHQQLVQDDIIPGTNDLNELETMIEKALTPEYFAKEQKLKKELFPYEGRACVDAFMLFQNDLFEDRVDQWYLATRRAIRENYIKERQQTQEKMDSLTRDMAQAKAELFETHATLIRTQGELIQLQEQLTQIKEEAGTLESDCNRLTDKIKAMENSRAWKFSKVLRKLFRLIFR